MSERSLRALRAEEDHKARRWPTKRVVVEGYGGCRGCGTTVVTEVLVAAYSAVRDPQMNFLKAGKRRLLGATCNEVLYQWVVEREFPASHGVWCWRCVKEEAKRWRSVTKR